MPENGREVCMDVRGPRPRMEDGVWLALLRSGMEGRAEEWAMGVLKALATEASIVVRERMAGGGVVC